MTSRGRNLSSPSFFGSESEVHQTGSGDEEAKKNLHSVAVSSFACVGFL